MEEQQEQVAGFLRQEEMNELIAQEQDPITADLMSQAAYVLVMTVGSQKTRPVADFDLRYFMEIIRDFVSDHEILKSTLEGNLRRESWLPDDSNDDVPSGSSSE